MTDQDRITLELTRDDATRLLAAVDRHRMHAGSSVRVLRLARGGNAETDPEIAELLADAMATCRSMDAIAVQLRAQEVAVTPTEAIAVVDKCGVTPLPHAWGSTDPDGLQACIRCGETRFLEPQPRALVAISEDRQWLVANAPGVFHRELGWGIYELQGANTCFELMRWDKDTGQSAESVLAAWLEGRSSP